MKDKILSKIGAYINEAEKYRETAFNLDNSQHYGDYTDAANDELDISFNIFRISVLTFLEGLLGTKSLYLNDFRNKVSSAELYNVDYSISLLKRIKIDIQDGWLIDFKALLSAEIFNDFLEMAEHLLKEGYKDAAAVIIGSVFEENIRQLCRNHKIETSMLDKKTKKEVFKRTSLLNDELYKSHVYNLNMNKAVVGWLAIRNSAAHGNYSEYDLSQVNNFLTSVRDFSAKFL